MTATNTDIAVQMQTIRYLDVPLAAGAKAVKGTMACIDTSTGTWKQGAASTTLIYMGRWNADFDNSAGGSSVLVNVDLEAERRGEWWANGSGITAANVGATAYILDNQTVTTTSTGHSAVGMILAVDSAKGVLVLPTRNGVN